MNLILKRILIITFILTLLFVLEVTSEESLIINLPTGDEIMASLLDKQLQEEQIIDQLKRDDVEDYNDLFDNSIKHTFTIKFEISEWEGLIDDMISYDQQFPFADEWLFNYRSNNYRNVDIVYETAEESFIIEDVGFRSKGNIYSRWLPIDDNGAPRPIHFMLKFNETFDTEIDTEEYTDLKTREVFDIEQLLFKMNNTGDATYTNEIFAFDLFNKAGVITPKASYALVNIQIGAFVYEYGLYNIFENFDEEFIRKNFQEVETKEVGDLYKVVWPGSLEPIDNALMYGVRDWESNFRPTYGKETNALDLTFSNLISFTYGLNDSDLEERYDYLNENFDIDNFIRSVAINVLLGNPDDYRGNANNYYLYFDENDYLTYIPFDYDNSMGSGWPAEEGFIDYTLGNDIYEWGDIPWNDFGAPLVDNLFEYEEYRLLYEQYLLEFMTMDYYSIESYLELYNEAFELYGEDVDMEFDKDLFITEKITKVRNDILYYQSLRN